MEKEDGTSEKDSGGKKTSQGGSLKKTSSRKKLVRKLSRLGSWFSRPSSEVEDEVFAVNQGAGAEGEVGGGSGSRTSFSPDLPPGMMLLRLVGSSEGSGDDRPAPTFGSHSSGKCTTDGAYLYIALA